MPLINTSGIGSLGGSSTPPPLVDQVNTTASRTLTLSDFDGTTVIYMDNAGANTVTVPPGLVPTQAALIVQRGAGTTTLVAGGGVTLKSKGNKVALNGVDAAVSIVPSRNTANRYQLIGDLA